MQKSLLCCIIIVAAVIVSYANTLGNGFVWDDTWLIEQNNLIKSFSNIRVIFTSHLGSSSPGESNNFYRPLQELSFALDYFLWGKDPLGYHLSNLLLHAAYSLLVFGLGMMLLKSRPAAFLAAIFFAVHPVNTEAVTYVAGRADILMSIFLCASFYFFLKYLDRHYTPYLVASLGAFLGGMISKEAAVIFPLILGAYFLARKEPALPKTKAVQPLVRIDLKVLAPYAALLLVYVFLRLTVLDFSKEVNTITEIERSPLFFRLITSFKALALYVGLLAAPLNLHMERSLTIPKAFDPADFVIAAIMIGLIAAVLYGLYRKRSIGLFCVLWFLIGLFPTANFFPINATMAEHWLYFPSIGLFWIAGLAAVRGFKKAGLALRIGFIGGLSVLLTWYASLTIARNPVWHDDKAIFENTLKYSPDAYKVWNNYGTYFNKKGDFDSAIPCFKKAIAINGGYYLPYDNVSFAYWKKNDAEDALNLLSGYIAKYPDEPAAWSRLGDIYERLGMLDKARDIYLKAEAQFPGNNLFKERLSKLSSGR
ncbi:MAG: tetratricopeptide repeat protein [Candidatus Omnitrophica bacterium]|nr:tetratricopeptide repeat protein [Candidatus Omnitrophota bacterium]